ncbi:MAG: hypothetical protein ACLSUS_03800 [Opitutales bacterium]
MRVYFSNIITRHNTNFKRDIKEDEYVHVPLIWDNTPDEFIKSTAQTSKATEQPAYNAKTQENSGSKFSKFKKNATYIGGGLIAAPTVITSTVKSYSNAIKENKEAIESGMESLAEIKDNAKRIFHKNEQNKTEDVSSQHITKTEENTFSKDYEDDKPLSTLITDEEPEDETTSEEQYDNEDDLNFDADYIG